MRFTQTLSAVIALYHYVESARVLGLFPHTGRSHQMVYEPLLRRLAERGHHVTVVSFFPLDNPPENYTDVSLEGIARPALESVDLRRYENWGYKIVRSLGFDKLLMKFGKSIALKVCSELVKYTPLVDVLRKEYDVVLVENFNSDCMLGLAHVYGINAPKVALLPSAMMPWSADRIGISDNPSYLPIRSSGYASKMTLVQRLENTFLNIYYKLWYRYMIQLKEKEIIETYFGRTIPDLQVLATNVSLMLVNVFHSLNGPRPLLPGVVEVGGMHLNQPRKSIPSYIERFLNESHDGVVLVSFGSLIRTSTVPKYREELLVSVLSKLKQRVIWKYENSGVDGDIQGNILKVRWLPQYELLEHEKVVAFIGHGGLLGMTEAISAGKPMLVVPFFGDQPNNGRRAQEIGLGRTLPYAELTEESLSVSLQAIISLEMRISALRASKIWKDRQNDPLDTAVFWIERVVRWGLKDQLHSNSRDMPLYQYLLLDVAAVLGTITFILFIFVSIIFTITIRVINVGMKKKLKTH